MVVLIGRRDKKERGRGTAGNGEGRVGRNERKPIDQSKVWYLETTRDKYDRTTSCRGRDNGRINEGGCELLRNEKSRSETSGSVSAN